MSTLIQRDQELPNMIGTDLTDIRHTMLHTEQDEGVELLAIELDGSSNQITRTAGMPLDTDPLL